MRIYFKGVIKISVVLNRKSRNQEAEKVMVTVSLYVSGEPGTGKFSKLV